MQIIVSYILLFAHFLTWYFWRDFFSRPNAAPICWEFFQGCGHYDWLYHVFFPTLYHFYIILIVAGVLFAFKARFLKVTHLILGMLFVIKISLHLSDFRLMGNYHYIHHVLQLSYFLLPYSLSAVQLMIVLCYFFAGTLKFNSDWLSGQALTSPSWIQGDLLKALLIYVIYLEMFVCWFLLQSRRNWLFWFALIQFYLFHAYSWHIVGYFYPSLMFAFLLVFLLQPFDIKVLMSHRVQIAILFFISAQLLPVWSTSNSSLSGVGRTFSLNMLDARSECETNYFIKNKDQYTIEEGSDLLPQFALRIHCDPRGLISELEKKCQRNSHRSEFLDIDLSHQVRRASGGAFEVLFFKNICSQPLTMNWLGEVVQKTK